MNVLRFRKLSIVSLFVAAGYAVTVFLKGTAFVLAHVVPVLQIVDVCAAFVCVPLLGLAGFRKTRPVAADGFLLLAYLFGVSNWMCAFVVLCASPPINPVCYIWAGLWVFFSLPGRIIGLGNSSGSILGFMAAFPACAVVNALLYDAPFAIFIIGMGLTYVFIALFISSTGNSGTQMGPAGSTQASFRPPASLANSTREAPKSRISNPGAGMKPRGPLAGWAKYFDTEARIISGQAGTLSKETQLDPSPKKISSSSPSDKPSKKVVRCPGCNKKLSPPAGKTGQVKCSRCGRMFKAAT
jgi:hypothetical protein